MTPLHGNPLHRILRLQTQKFLEEIEGPIVGRTTIVDGLLDLRNLGNGRDLGLEMTIDDMLEDLPVEAEISAEWWLDCLSHLTDHATWLAAGFPAVVPAPTSSPTLVAV